MRSYSPTLSAALLGCAFVTVVTTPATAQVAHLDYQGREWRQLTGTTALTWNQVAAVCPTDGITPATGTLGSVSVTGWVWATAPQVQQMLSGFVPELATSTAVGGANYVLPGLGFTSVFTPTAAYYTTFGGYLSVSGWTATSNNGQATLGSVDAQYPVFYGGFSVADAAATTTASSGRGVWLYRQTPFHSVGNALAGTHGSAHLMGTGALTTGAPTHLTIDNGLPLAPAVLAFGLSAANVPLLGGTLVPNPEVVLAAGSFSTTGTLAMQFPWPAGLSGLSLFVQGWFFDPQAPESFAASNGLRIDAP